MVLTQVLGDIWLSRGMKEFGAANLFDLSGLVALILYLMTSPWIWLGIITLVTSLLLYYIAVSRLDLSFIVPVNASSYVFNALLAWIILKEQVSLIRWMAALTITLGVFIVSINKNLKTRKAMAEAIEQRSKSWFKRSIFFLFPLSISIPKTWLFVFIVAFSDGFGDLFNAMGMKKIGAIELAPLPEMLEVVKKIITNPWIIRGIICQTIAFLSFVCALSWADISFVRPATALTYIISLLGARFVLKERIDMGRFVGIIIVGIGIGMIAFDHGISH
ncbi:EamA family transporter [Gloeothece verrucosa]|uniref:EamA domain-containing protein n=1 Tax=Gloeothece verrucosa (strain PCC 7822) TaxID=497965 RepID=E0UC56_GLOV7|nr:EamA family transporter [Gloeothece verrucosa]ADN16394.1 protein of unknown function DUF6 transmembrane [Gloeothece verrucosa PCC 7822]